MGPKNVGLLISTRNRHKLEEIRAIFSPSGIELVGLDGFPDAPEVVEDGETFEANAVKKAVALATATGMWAMADDSGLEVDALDGAPGVYSARYAGEPADHRANNRRLLHELAGVTNRRARFHCTIALSDPRGNARVVEGRCEGRITHTYRGENGFGYDPVFVPEGYAQTFAEMDAAEKNRLSHRAAALAAANREWSEILAGIARGGNRERL